MQLNLLYIQLDEIWSYLVNKGNPLWVFIALEAHTKFWIGFELGSRTVYTANRMILQVKRFGRWSSEPIVKITTDKLAAYQNASLISVNRWNGEPRRKISRLDQHIVFMLGSRFTDLPT